MSALLRSRDVVEPLKAIGLLPDNTRRMIIDINAGEPVKVYYDTFASPTLVQVLTPEFIMGAQKILHQETPTT